MKIPKEWLFFDENFLDINLFQPITNIPMFCKPNGGLWVSPYEQNSEDGFPSDWYRFCIDIGWEKKLKNGTLIKLKDDVRIYIIDTQEDLIQLVNLYGSQKSLIPKMTMFNAIPDFEEISRHYDVIYLTKEGQWDTRIPFNNREYNLYGWDCESALIMNVDCIESWRKFE